MASLCLPSQQTRAIIADFAAESQSSHSGRYGSARTTVHDPVALVGLFRAGMAKQDDEHTSVGCTSSRSSVFHRGHHAMSFTLTRCIWLPFSLAGGVKNPSELVSGACHDRTAEREKTKSKVESHQTRLIKPSRSRWRWGESWGDKFQAWPNCQVSGRYSLQVPSEGSPTSERGCA